MKKVLFNILFIISPFVLFGQWNQMGTSLEGEFDGDSFGRVVSLNYAGDVMIVGTFDNPNAAGNALFPGMARVFDWNGTDWIQRGSDIDGTTDDWSGFNVEIDSTGNTIAVTSIYGDNALGYKPGLVRIYDWDGTNWMQRGDNIVGDGDPVLLEWFGSGLSLSADGNTVGIGGPNNNSNGFKAGFAKIFKWDGSQWTQVGSDLIGDEAYDTFGFSLSLSSDGTTVAVGGPGNLGFGNNEQGQMQVYKFNGTNWVQLGTTIYGDNDGDDYGRSVSLDNTGTILAVGAPRDNFAGIIVDSQVYVYEWDGSNWIQKGSTLIGENDLNNFGFQVRLNYTGNMLAASAPVYGTNGDVQVFQWAGSDWTQVGSTISGDNANDIFGAGLDISGLGDRLATGAYGHGDKGQVKVFEYESGVGIDEAANSMSVNIYPNPTNGILNIQNIEETTEILFNDLNGKKIFSRTISQNTQLSIADFPAGIYLIEIQNSTYTKQERLVKQ